MEKKLQNPTSNKNETPAPQGGKWPDETIIRYIIRAFLLLIVCLLYTSDAADD